MPATTIFSTYKSEVVTHEQYIKILQNALKNHFKESLKNLDPKLRDELTRSMAEGIKNKIETCGLAYRANEWARKIELYPPSKQACHELNLALREIIEIRRNAKRKTFSDKAYKYFKINGSKLFYYFGFELWGRDPEKSTRPHTGGGGGGIRG